MSGERAGFDELPCGYLATGADGLIVAVNRTFLTMTGYAEADLVGSRRFVDLLGGGGRIYHETHLAPMLQLHGFAKEIALDLVAVGGDRMPVLISASAGTDGVVHIAVLDATQRRGYEQELLRAKRQAEESEARAHALAETLQQMLTPPPPAMEGIAWRSRFTRRATGGSSAATSTTSSRSRRTTGPS